MSKIYTDGHLNGKNSYLFEDEAAQSGYTLMDVDGKRIKVSYKKEYLTNNEAEVIALIHALAIANHGDIIYSDSQLAINWLTKNWKVRKDPNRLGPLVAAGQSLYKLIHSLKGVEIKWVKRDKNPIT